MLKALKTIKGCSLGVPHYFFAEGQKVNQFSFVALQMLSSRQKLTGACILQHLGLL